MKHRSPLISVIIPVYNVEDYLDRCVESVVNQTYIKLQIILVDDGSTDASGTKCDVWAKKDKRIKVIHKENGGQGQARNYGMKVAKGDLFAFVDADDWVDTSMYEQLYSVMNETGVDIVECNWVRCWEYPCEVETESSNKTITARPEEAILELMNDGVFKQVPWNKLYRKDVIAGIKFPETRACEDEGWTYKIFGNANTIAKIDKVFYYYFQSGNSTMRKKYSAERLVIAELAQERADYCKHNFPSIYPNALKKYAGACIFHFQMLCNEPDVDPDKTLREELYKRYSSIPYSFLLFEEPTKQRIWKRALAKFPYATCAVRNKLKIGF